MSGTEATAIGCAADRLYVEYCVAVSSTNEIVRGLPPASGFASTQRVPG